MLKRFFEYSYLAEVKQIASALHDKKLELQSYNFSRPYEGFQEAEALLDRIKEYAVEHKIEELANAQLIARTYFRMFCQLSEYFKLLFSEEYEKTWNVLQSCLDSAFLVGQHTAIENRCEVPQIVDLLTGYEGLYPYRFFGSVEMVILKSECSICGNAFSSIDCPHIKGNLYWGEIAQEIITEVESEAVALVEHPLDKRCVLMISNDKRTEKEKFALLIAFTKQHISPFQTFSIEKQEAEPHYVFHLGTCVSFQEN